MKINVICTVYHYDIKDTRTRVVWVIECSERFGVYWCIVTNWINEYCV